MRLVFFYTHARNVTPEDLISDGLTFMFQKMIETGIIDECLCIIDSYNLLPAHTTISKGLTCAVINDINQARCMIREGDIIFIRGGFKPWIDLINELRAKNNWILFYGANTGNERWDFWDVVLDDLSGETKINKNGSLQLEYFKPVNEDIFYNTNQDRIYDVMIGASHIHDKKGQWKVIDAIIEYEKQTGTKLKCVLPGSFQRGVETSKIQQKIINHKLDVNITGMLPRPELAKVYNQSKLLIKMGGGQNDRSVLEGRACGCIVHVEVKERSAPFATNMLFNKSPLRSIQILQDCDINARLISNKFKRLSGMSEVILPNMEKLFNFFKKYPKADRTKLKELL